METARRLPELATQGAMWAGAFLAIGVLIAAPAELLAALDAEAEEDREEG